MSEVATLIADMVRAGVDPDLIGRTAEALACREPVKIIDEQAERRRAADRDRKRLRISADSAESAEVFASRAEPPISTSENPTRKVPKETPPTEGQRKGPAKHLFPETFEPKASTVEAARTRWGYSEADVRERVEALREWSHGKGEKRCDWDLVLLGALRRDAQRMRQGTGPPRRREPTYSDMRREAERQLAELEARPDDHRPDPVLRLVAH